MTYMISLTEARALPDYLKLQLHHSFALDVGARRFSLMASKQMELQSARYRAEYSCFGRQKLKAGLGRKGVLPYVGWSWNLDTALISMSRPDGQHDESPKVCRFLLSRMARKKERKMTSLLGGVEYQSAALAKFIPQSAPLPPLQNATTKKKAQIKNSRGRVRRRILAREPQIRRMAERRRQRMHNPSASTTQVHPAATPSAFSSWFRTPRHPPPRPHLAQRDPPGVLRPSQLCTTPQLPKPRHKPPQPTNRNRNKKQKLKVKDVHTNKMMRPILLHLHDVNVDTLFRLSWAQDPR
ncbi:hypothetical protein K438DRAFT_1784777 [Mycena galopus ATCC 62051]|nr:hypothetical protein K438DRAFT_1784777 [Mycena galopus ATCC 62051]